MIKIAAFSLAILLTVIVPLRAQTNTPSNAPYLYYFSPILNAFVVERADGTDSRTLGKGMIDPEANTAWGEWSPSGKWFAWRSTNWISFGETGYKGGIVSADGIHQIGLLDNMENIAVLDWLTNDWLLVSAYVQLNAGMTQYVLDVANDNVLIAEEIQPTVEYAADFPELCDVTMRNADEIIPDPHFPDVTAVGRMAFSPNIRYIGLGDNFAILDRFTGQVTTIPIHSAAASAGVRGITQYEWYPSSEWVIISDNFFNAGGGGCGPNASLVTRNDGEMRRELSVGRTAPTWLPQPAASYLATGQAQSVLRQPLLTLYHSNSIDYVNTVGWNAEGTRFATITDTGQISVWEFDGITATQIKSFDADNDCRDLPVGCQIEWSENGDHIYVRNFTARDSHLSAWAWTSGDEIILSLQENQFPQISPSVLANDGRLSFNADLYNPISITSTADGNTIEQLNWYARMVALSPDQRFLAAVNSTIVTIWDVSDITKIS